MEEVTQLSEQWNTQKGPMVIWQNIQGYTQAQTSVFRIQEDLQVM